MIEAELTCICRRIELPDLGLILTRKKKICIPYADAEASSDLYNARRNGAVAVRPIKRYNQKRPASMLPTPEPARPRLNPQPVTQVPPVVQAVVDRIPPGLTRKEVADEVKAQLVEMESRLLAALSNMQPQVVHHSGATPPITPPSVGKVQDDTPMFIPGNLVAREVKGDIRTSKSESSDSGVGDATAALKAARKKKK
jgi:hypothetical protein